MKRVLFLCASCIFVLWAATSCIFMGPSVEGNGNVKEETRQTGEFSAVAVSRGLDVVLSQGEPAKVVVKADENLLDVIETRTEGDRLIVTANENIRRASSKKVFVTSPRFVEIKSSAGSRVAGETQIKSKDLKLSALAGSSMNLDVIAENVEISASTGSNLKLKLQAENVDAGASAGSNIQLEGKTNRFTGKVSAGSNIKAEEFTAEVCSAKAGSGGNIWITVNTEISAKAGSGGNVFYFGNPENKTIEKSSGGNVIQK